MGFLNSHSSDSQFLPPSLPPFSFQIGPLKQRLNRPWLKCCSTLNLVLLTECSQPIPCITHIL